MGVFRRNVRGQLALTYSIRFTRADGTRQTLATSATTREEAESLLKAMEAKIQAAKEKSRQVQRVTSSEECTLSAAFERAYQERWQYQASDKPQQHIPVILDILGDVPLSSITSSSIAQLRGELISRGLAPATVNRHLSTLKTTLRLAHYEWGILDRLTKVSLLSEKGNERTFLYSDQHLETICKYFAETHQQYMIDLTYVLLNTGLRVSELLSLKWSEVSWSEGTITIVAQLAKSRVTRVVPMNAIVQQILHKRPTIEVGPFPYSLHTIESKWRRMKVATGLRDAVLHCLRHTFATRLISKGKDLYIVQRLLGHSTPAVTTRYSHMQLSSLREAVADLDTQSATQTISG